MSEWRPIRTAPKVVDPVLLYDGIAMTSGCWDHDLQCWALWVPGKHAKEYAFEATYWMPLPEAPKENA